MASPSRPAKQLKELLQEKQEPFVLTTYLSERRYMRSVLNLDAKNGCSPDNSADNLKRSKFGPELSTKRERRANCSSSLQSVLKKLVSNNESWKISTNNASEIQENGTPDHSPKCRIIYSPQFFKENRGSSSSASTFQAFEPFDIKGQEPATETNLQCAIMDDRQLSPVSVLETLPSSQGQHFIIAGQEETLSSPSFHLQKRTTENSTDTSSPWELLIQSDTGIAKLEKIFGFSGCSQHLKTIRIMQKTKQVSFDSNKEAIEIHGMDKVQKNKEFQADEEPLKNISEHFCHREKQHGNVRSITKLINADFSTPKQECSNSYPLTKEIGIEIADAVIDQIVTDIISFFL